MCPAPPRVHEEALPLTLLETSLVNTNNIDSNNDSSIVTIVLIMIVVIRMLVIIITIVIIIITKIIVVVIVVLPAVMRMNQKVNSVAVNTSPTTNIFHSSTKEAENGLDCCTTTSSSL